MVAVGTSMPRVDARAKVTGRAQYVDDLPFPDALHGATVRTSVPHGVLRAIRRDPAFDWEGVVFVTADDIPGRNCILLETDDQPALVAIGSRVRHAAEAVALVAAPTRERARAAAAHVCVDVDALPAVLTIEESLDQRTLVAEGGNVLRELRIERGDVDAAFATADVVIEGTYRTGAAEHVYIEPQGMVAWWSGDRVHVIGSMQCPYYAHKALVALLGLPEDQVEVEQATTGGGFGGKEEFPSVPAAHAALLARRAGMPVKLIYERGEDIAATTKRHPSVIRHRIAATADGSLIAADVDVVLDAGAYVTLSPVVLMRSMIHATGPYRFDAVRIRGRAVATNTPPSGAFRGFGAPQSQFAAERQVAKLSRRLGVDPIALRRANALRPGDPAATGGSLDGSAALVQVLDALEAHLARAPAHPTTPTTRPVRRGRGIAAAFHGAGFTGAGESKMAGKATVALTESGTFQVLTSCVDMGQGARTVLAQIAADALGVDVALVDVPQPSTAFVLDTGPTVASRTTLVAGTVVQRAARRLHDDLLDWARPHGVGCDVGGVAGICDIAEVASRRATACEGDDLPAFTEAYALPARVQWDQETLSGDAYPTFAWSATAVDVAVDDDTSEVTVERCVQVVDAGRAINPLAVEGQIHGGTLQALGWALCEHVERSDGVIRAPSLSTTIVPTAPDAPELEAVVVEVPCEDGPHGAKGIGELPMDSPAAAVASAIEDALGVPVDVLPALPETIHALVSGDAA